jgi:hypothetical protein
LIAGEQETCLGAGRRKPLAQIGRQWRVIFKVDDGGWLCLRSYAGQCNQQVTVVVAQVQIWFSKIFVTLSPGLGLQHLNRTSFAFGAFWLIAYGS